MTACRDGVELHKRTYYPLRVQHPHLPAQLVCAARVKATESVKSALTWKKKHEARYPQWVERAKKSHKPIPAFKPVRCPQSKLTCIRYDQRSSWVNWETNTASLATTKGRVELPFRVPDSALLYIRHKTWSADLCYRHGNYWLHIVVSLAAADIVASDEIIGVDLGLNRPAVTSKHDFLGERRWKEQERRIFRLKRHLQAKGTKSAKRHVRKLSGKLFRQRKDHDHVLSKRIVQRAPQGATIVLENVTNIRENVEHRKGAGQRRLHSWSFAQFYSFVSYKAEARGMGVMKVDPRHTSQTCSRCGYQHRDNRRSQSLFHCRSCDYQLNADYNAAKNIRSKHLANLGTSSIGGPQSIGLSSQPLVG